MRRAVAHRSHRWAWLSTATPPPAAAAAAAAAVGAAAPDSGVVPARRRQSKADREKLLAAEKSDEHSFTAVLRALSVNGLITVIKFAAYWKTGSSSMLAEAIHTLVDTGNQAILVIGLQQSRRLSDVNYNYGYGRAAFFWALVSALGMFWMGAGVTVVHGVHQLLHPPQEWLPGWETWGVLGVSFALDGYVLVRTLKDLHDRKPAGVSMWAHLKKSRDPFTLAVLMEDFAACTGVVIAAGGIGLTAATGDPMWDSLASIGVGCLLGTVAVTLVRINQRFLLGRAIDAETEAGIRDILKKRKTIEAVYRCQSQWLGPTSFSFKAEVDFDGTFLAANLTERYNPRFVNALQLKNDEALNKELSLLLAWHAEDVTRLVEREVREVEALIKEQYPMAAYIELEPHSKLTNRLALADYLESASKESELRAIEEARELLLADMNKLRASRYAEGYELDDGDEAEEHWQDRRQDEPPKGQRG